MLKRLAILAGISALMAVCVSGQPNKAGDNKNGPPNKPQPPPPTVGESSHGNYYNSYNAPAKADDEPFQWHTAIKRAEWWAIGIAIGTMGLIYWQARETRRAAVATRDAAEAALLNAKALVNSERAWLVAEVVRDERMPHLFEVQITNHGRTPAEFIRGDATHAFIELPENLPVPPVYNSPIVIPRQTLIVTDKGFAIPHGYSMVHILARPEAAGKVFVIYGRILYSDTIIPTVEHETRWCFGYVPDAGGLIPKGDFVLTGPDEYTKHS